MLNLAELPKITIDVIYHCEHGCKSLYLNDCSNDNDFPPIHALQRIRQKLSMKEEKAMSPCKQTVLGKESGY